MTENRYTGRHFRI